MWGLWILICKGGTSHAVNVALVLCFVISSDGTWIPGPAKASEMFQDEV